MDLGEIESVADSQLTFIKEGRLPELKAAYARPVLTAAERKVWIVLNDGRLQLRPEINEADLPAEFLQQLALGRQNGRYV